MDFITEKLVALGRIGFYIFLVGFTAMQTWNLLLDVSKNPIIATLGLVLFEGSMIYWWLVFRKEAKGIEQLTLSLLLAALGLLFVGGATALHLDAVSITTLGRNTPAKLITVAVLVNLVGKFVYPLLEPGEFGRIWREGIKGALVAGAYKEAKKLTQKMTPRLARDVGRAIYTDARNELLTEFGLRPLLNESDIIDAEHEFVDVDEEEEDEEEEGYRQLGLFDRFLDRFNLRDNSNGNSQPVPTPAGTDNDQPEEEDDQPEGN